MRRSKVAIGLIAEDKTDSQAAATLVRRILRDRGHDCLVHSRQTQGGGRMISKGAAFMRDLAREGCSVVILVHDLDRNAVNGELNDLRALRQRLDALATPPRVNRFTCIPVEELEAWFWSDPAVLQQVVARRDWARVRAKEHPERLAKPKEALIRLSRRHDGKAAYDTSFNGRLAEMLDLRACASRCPSFAQLKDFLGSLE